MRNDLLFCIAATIRPEILDATLRSFQEYCTPGIHNFGAVIHVDCAPPNPESTAHEVCRVATSYFGKVHSIVAAANCGYAASAHKLISCAVASSPPVSHVFWLEDDWKARRPFNLDDMLAVFNSSDGSSAPILQVRLARGSSMNNSVICTSPGIYSMSLCRLLRDKLDTSLSFESQVKSICDATFSTRKCARTYLPKQRDTVVDIGREWREQRGIFKPNELGGKKRTFTRWVDKRNAFLE